MHIVFHLSLWHVVFYLKDVKGNDAYAVLQGVTLARLFCMGYSFRCVPSPKGLCGVAGGS